MTDATKIAASSGSALDIIVFVAHLELTTAELEGLVRRMIGELKWPALSGQIYLIISDHGEFSANANQPVVVIRASVAAGVFRQRCRVLEASPHDILIAFGDYLPTGDTIAQLRLAVRDDEMASAVAPRIAIGPQGELVALGPRLAPNASGLIDSKYVPKLSPVYYLPEILCPCMLVSHRMTGNVEIPDNFNHFPDLILAFLRAGRRRGLLVRIENRLSISADAEFDAEILQQETEKMLQLYDDYELAARRLTAHPAYTDERRFQLLRRPSATLAGSLLLECTNIAPSFSGSADHALGVLKGIAQIEHAPWSVAVMVTHEAQSFFSLDVRFPSIRFVSNSDESYYDCAIRLSQPWSISVVADLNRRARSIAVTILDTIGPDVIYAVPEESEEAFQFVAEHAEGLIYISEFSRNQFRRRFMCRPDLVESVIHLSLDPAEYVPGAGSSDGEWILIFGNAYDHKDVERTTKIVSAAFPFEKVKVVGKRELGGSNVEAFDSGSLDGEFIGQLFRQAKCVVFPSFYEGFGLPLIRGLAHEKIVIARRSSVFPEVLAGFPKVGRFVEFENSLELVPILGKVLHGKSETSSSYQETGASPATAAHDWQACAGQIFAFAEQLRNSENVEVWRARDRALRYIKARGP